MATYSASEAERKTICCFLLCHETKQFLNKSQVPLVLFLSDLKPATLELEKPTKLHSLPLGNQRSWCEVPLRHLKTIFTILKCDSLGGA